MTRFTDADVTYPERGATQGRLPPGYHHTQRRVRIGAGPAAFEQAVAALLSWRIHEGAGLTVLGGPTPTVGAIVVTRLGPSRVGQLAPTRIIMIIDETRRRGFVYGTLPGHPFVGEESFIVERADDESVFFAVRAFSRPANLLVRLGLPVARLVQAVVTRRFIDAARKSVSS